MDKMVLYPESIPTAIEREREREKKREKEENILQLLINYRPQDSFPFKSNLAAILSVHGTFPDGPRRHLRINLQPKEDVESGDSGEELEVLTTSLQEAPPKTPAGNG